MVKNKVLTRLCYITLISLFSTPIHAELLLLDDDSLADTSARSGLTIDIDLSGVSFVYNYKNNGNPNEEFWISAANTGGDLVEIKGVTVDVAAVPGIGSAIALGAPSDINLSNVNTGDYFIARPNASDPNSPSKPSDIVSSSNRKLFGLAWNTNIGIDFPEAGAASVESHTFENAPFQAAGSLLIFAD